MPRETNIQIRRGTASDWASVNPTLASGEMAIENDTRRFKVGDGTTAWNELQYVRLDGGSLDGESPPSPTATPVPPTATPVPPTATPEPTPEPTPVPPTATPEPTVAAQSCDSFGNCYYCGALFQAPRIFGTFTVTGAGSVTFTDPNDANNPYNGTFDINGTYTYNNGVWSKDNGRLQIALWQGDVAIGFDVCSSEGPYAPCSAGDVGNGYCLDSLWTTTGSNYSDIQNNCSSYVFGAPQANEYYYCAPNGITVTGSAPTVTWNPDNTNRTICNNAGGVYAGVWHSYYPFDGSTSNIEECLIYTLVPDADGGGSGGACATPSSPGGSYTFVSKNSFAGDTTDYSIGGVGTCCSGDCVTPFTDCSGASGISGAWGSC